MLNYKHYAALKRNVEIVATKDQNKLQVNPLPIG
jgi:hypothetical protein